MNLTDELDTYLSQRRALGYQLKTSEYLLRQFCTWLADHGSPATCQIPGFVEDERVIVF